MGLLSEGHPMSWEETKCHAEEVRIHGIRQFINMYQRLKDRQDECLKWGDEVEYILVKMDHEERKARLLLKAGEILPVMDIREKEQGPDRKVLWRPEFADYQIESSPGQPCGDDSTRTLLSNFKMIQKNMEMRRREILEFLGKDEMMLSMTSFPRLGCPNFTSPHYEIDPTQTVSGSLFFPDEAIMPYHPRFKTLVGNIRSRRGRKVVINTPIFKDVKTPDPFVEKYPFEDREAQLASKADHVYQDCMGFGMGLCCLQVTFQASNLDEALVLYDQLTPVCPIVLALSASSPIQRGFLVDRDCRWDIISQAVDDRTKEELGEEPLNFNRFRINKSRYDSIDSYISPSSSKYNDIPLIFREDFYHQMVQEGVDEPIAKHVAHLFIRDPIVVYKEKMVQDDAVETDHFENIQSTNWQTMRFKPPPPNSSIGWRVEFRPCEVQITDFENAAFVVFVVLLTRVILSYNLNLLIPISKVDENMQEAQKRDSVKRSKFWFRKDIITQIQARTSSTRGPTSTTSSSSRKEGPSSDERVTSGSESKSRKGCPNDVDGSSCPTDGKVDESCSQMTADEIINGSPEFPGLVPLLRQYLLTVDVDADTHCTINQYLNLIAGRASGKLLTTAQWIRNFVRDHPDYKQDSVVTESMNYDLINILGKMTRGEMVQKDLFGENPIMNSLVKNNTK